MRKEEMLPEKKKTGKVKRLAKNVGKSSTREKTIGKANERRPTSEKQTEQSTKRVPKSKSVQKQKNNPSGKDTSSERKLPLSGGKASMGIVYFFAALFLIMAGYMAYFIAFEADSVVENPYNRRQNYFAEKVIRGDILSSDGTVLATTEVKEDGTEVRIYPYGRMFSHVVGYTTNGKGGVESTANYALLTSNENIFTQMMQEFRGEKKNGDSVKTTLDVKWQQAAYDALTCEEGAVVVMEPSTGKILAMVSKPDFEPGELDELLSATNDDSEDSFLVNRASQGLYPPGSTFKMITLLEYFRENQNLEDFTFDCDGSVTVDNYELHCAGNRKHGHLNLKSAFAVSCNGAFATIGQDLDIDKLNTLTDSLLFGKELPFVLPYRQSSFSLTKDSTDFLVGQTVIGQGETLVTPLHMAMIMSAISNDGVLMTPYLEDERISNDGKVIKKTKSEKYGNLISATEASTLKEYLKEVTNTGTASRLKSGNYEIYGKTGTAQTGKDGVIDSWFVGGMNADGKEYVFCVVAANISENAASAVNITGNMLKNAGF